MAVVSNSQPCTFQLVLCVRPYQFGLSVVSRLQVVLYTAAAIQCALDSGHTKHLTGFVSTPGCSNMAEKLRVLQWVSHILVTE